MNAAKEPFRIEVDRRLIRVDLRMDPGRGGSAPVAEDDVVRVSVGSLGAIVEFKSVGLLVQLDYIDGDWRDLGWAARQAVQGLARTDVLLELLPRLCTMQRAEGERAGKTALRKQLRDLLLKDV